MGILCVHGDKVSYPTAKVNLRLGQWSCVVKVVVAPDIPVPVLLGTDIYNLTIDKPVMVTTRAQAKRNDTNKDPVLVREAGSQNQLQDPNSSLVENTTTEQGKETTTERRPNEQGATPTERSEESTVEKESVEQRREEVSNPTPHRGNPLEATTGDIREWQAKDTTLEKAREEAGEGMEDV